MRIGTMLGAYGISSGMSSAAALLLWAVKLVVIYIIIIISNINVLFKSFIWL
jgi:hypothetical protein